MPLTDVRALEDGLPFGVRIGGLTRDALREPPVRAAINDLFEREGMIVFEGVEPSAAMQLALSEVFGPLKEHPVKAVARVDAEGMPGVVEIRQPPDSGGLVEIAGEQLSHWLPWHFDHCYNNELNRAGVLRAVTITEHGGLTGFADGIALYEAFPAELLARIEGRDVVYTLDVQYETMRFGRSADFRVVRRKPLGADFEEQARRMPRALHPAVWTRADGRKVLHISPWMADGLAGAEDEAGHALFEEVCQTINRLAAPRSYHHRWRPDDMVIWDNWRMLHSVSGNPPGEERAMHRTTIRGDYGLGRFEGDGIGGKILETTV